MILGERRHDLWMTRHKCGLLAQGLNEFTRQLIQHAGGRPRFTALDRERKENRRQLGGCLLAPKFDGRR